MTMEKPFAFLLSIEVLTFKKINALLTEKGACIYLIAGRPKFFHEGRSVQVGGLIWVIGNYKHTDGISIEGTISLSGRSADKK